MSWACLRAKVAPDASLQSIVEGFVRDDKQYNPAIAVKGLRHSEGILNPWNGVHHSINFGGSNAHTFGVECGIETTQNDKTTGGSCLRKISVGPYSLETLKVSTAHSRSIGVAEEVERG